MIKNSVPLRKRMNTFHIHIKNSYQAIPRTIKWIISGTQTLYLFPYIRKEFIILNWFSNNLEIFHLIDLRHFIYSFHTHFLKRHTYPLIEFILFSRFASNITYPLVQKQPLPLCIWKPIKYLLYYIWDNEHGRM